VATAEAAAAAARAEATRLRDVAAQDATQRAAADAATALTRPLVQELAARRTSLQVVALCSLLQPLPRALPRAPF